MSISILILDFGSQYSELIARRVRELGVYCEVHPFDLPPSRIEAMQPLGIIFSGGPDSVYENLNCRIPEIVFQLNIPLLGICYGMHAMAEQLGGRVEGCVAKEFGLAHLKLENNPLFAGLSPENRVWMSHGDQVKALPSDFIGIAISDNTPFAAMCHKTKPWYGVQFHPEVTHTEEGMLLFKNFVVEICGCKPTWSGTEILKKMTDDVRLQVGPHDKVLLGLSGGVDSFVLAVFHKKILGERLIPVFIDTGLLRYKEAEHLKQVFEEFNLNVIMRDASALFLERLQGETEPEAKRKIIGKAFIDVFEDTVKNLHEVQYLAQGTIYSDVIESAATKTGKAQVIKSHHNVGGLPKSLPFKLLEPFRTLFKDEVRKVGRALNIPESLIMRHPFPGAGLGVRILEEVKPEYVAILQHADHIYLETLKKYDWYHRCAQAFAVFLPVRSVSVKGDGRKYEYVIALRAVESTDFMTAHPVRVPFEVLEEAALRIVNEVPHVSRVTYDITGKPPATIEWE